MYDMDYNWLFHIHLLPGNIPHIESGQEKTWNEKVFFRLFQWMVRIAVLVRSPAGLTSYLPTFSEYKFEQKVKLYARRGWGWR